MVFDPRAARWYDLIVAASRDFDLPMPRVTNDDEADAYLRALIRHVDSRDYARGYELRVGARQADWSPAQVQAFADFMKGKPFSDPERMRKPYAAFAIDRSREFDPPVTVDMLRVFVDATVVTLVNMRAQSPALSLPIIVVGLLANGEVISAPVDRDQRIGFVHLMARHEPLFGWLVAADMFIHQIKLGDGDDKAASKQDAIGVHFGTRADRAFLTRPYTVVADVVRFEPERVVDLKASSGGDHWVDPYAFIFMPPTTGATPS